ncbi:MAG: protein kinase, partial [Dehalococcoidia bacterium]
MAAACIDGTAERQTESILSLVLDACSGPAAVAGWTVKPVTPDEVWIEVANHHAGIPSQGWKLHISATAESAATVLRRALPVILREPAGFKVAASLPHLERLNSGDAGPTQAGKFITVYPMDDDQAVRLAVALDQATRGLPGPAVPSDRPLRPGSLVHYRYGAFVPRYMQTLLGEVTPALAAPDGSLSPDRRTINYSAPVWAVDPFVAAGVVIPRPRPSLLAGRHYLTVAVLQQSPRSIVRLAVNTRTGSRCVLKQVRDAVSASGDRLRHEAAVLRELAPDPRFPRIFDLFEHHGDLYLAMEHCDGLTLEQYVAQLAVQGRFLSADQVIAWGCSLAEMLGALHHRGIVYGDLKAPNVIVTPDENLHLIDFETVSRMDMTLAPEHAGTPGYMSPERSAGRPPAIADDIYSLGALLYFMTTGADPSHAPNPQSLLDRPP